MTIICVCVRVQLLRCSECLYMQERRSGNGTWLLLERCREMRGVQHRADNQSRQNRVHAYVFARQFNPVPKLNAVVRCNSTVNACTCENGVGQTGAGCPLNGAAKCASCHTGFTINDERTKCIRTCVRFGWFDRIERSGCSCRHPGDFCSNYAPTK